MVSPSWNSFCFGTAMVTSQILFCLLISIKMDNLKTDCIALISGASIEVVYKPSGAKVASCIWFKYKKSGHGQFLNFCMFSSDIRSIRPRPTLSFVTFSSNKLRTASSDCLLCDVCYLAYLYCTNM
jgi:hypothetical protein